LGVITGVAADTFPTAPQRFDIFAALTDGQGEVTITLSVVHLDTNQETYSQRMTVRFPDPLRVVNLRFQVRQLIIDAAGTYLFALMLADQEIAARWVPAYQVGESP
jgi:hypothetical protein